MLWFLWNLVLMSLECWIILHYVVKQTDWWLWLILFIWFSRLDKYLYSYESWALCFSCIHIQHHKKGWKITAPQPDQLSKFWIEQIVCLIYFYKISTQLIFITITCGGEPQLLLSENFSCSFTKNATKPLWPSTSQQPTCFWKIWIGRKFHLAFI